MAESEGIGPTGSSICDGCLGRLPGVVWAIGCWYHLRCAQVRLNHFKSPSRASFLSSVVLRTRIFGCSTVSSGVNSLAASITEDYIRKWRPGLSDTQMAYTSKISALVTGLLAFGFVFVAEQMGNIF